MYAIVEISGKQYKVQEGDVVFVDRLEKVEEGSDISFEKVLLVSDETNLAIGDNIVAGAIVKASVIGHGKSKKIIVFRYKAKKNVRKVRGHRQPYTKIQIESITTGFKSEKTKADKIVKEETEQKA